MVAGVRAGEDRRVVRERDRRQRRHRAVPERGAHRRSGARRSAPRRARPCRRARWSSCRRTGSRRRAAGRSRRIEHVGERVAVLDREVACRRRAARSRAARRSSARRRRAGPPAGSTPSVLHALAADHQRRAGLHDAERAVLAEVAALVLPVVRGRVDHAEVGRGRASRRAARSARRRTGRRCRVRCGCRLRLLVVEAARTCRSTGRRAGCGPRLATSSKSPSLGRARSVTRPSGGERLVAVVAAGEHHVDDRLERGVEQDLEGAHRPRRGARRRSGGPRAASVRVTGSTLPRGPAALPAQLAPVVTGVRRPAILSRSPERPASSAAGRSATRPNVPKEAVSVAHVHAPTRPTSPGVARDRRRGRDPRPHVDRDRDAAARQAQADLGAARRHRRPRDRRQRVEARDLAAQEGDRQAVPPPHRLPGRHPDREPRAPARARPREGRAAGREAHAAEGPARPRRC